MNFGEFVYVLIGAMAFGIVIAELIHKICKWWRRKD